MLFSILLLTSIYPHGPYSLNLNMQVSLNLNIPLELPVATATLLDMYDCL